MTNLEYSNTNPILSNDEIELKIRKLEFVITASTGFLLNSQLKEDEFFELYSSLEVHLGGVMYDVIHAGHSQDCVFVKRIIDGTKTINSASKCKAGKS